jgi:AraC-like DNA-binding protein
VSFSESESCVVLPEEALNLRLPNACSEAASALEKAASDALLDPSSSTIESQVRSVVNSQLPNGDYSESAVAEALHMSVRTLKRRLAESEWSFTSLVDDIRRRIALDLLLSSAATLEEIAPQAGYASPGSLVRAVKRWTGYTPVGLRAARAGGLRD